jgi:Rrf2 family protein
MKISTRGRYALRAMIELALRSSEEPLMVREIATAQIIPQDYLEQVLIVLRKAGLVRSIRGAGGGYLLNKTPEELNALEIIEAVEGSFQPLECIEAPTLCTRSAECVARDLWCEASEAMRSVLRNTTLAELRERQRSRSGMGGPYQI